MLATKCSACIALFIIALSTSSLPSRDSPPIHSAPRNSMWPSAFGRITRKDFVHLRLRGAGEEGGLQEDSAMSGTSKDQRPAVDDSQLADRMFRARIEHLGMLSNMYSSETKGQFESDMAFDREATVQEFNRSGVERAPPPLVSEEAISRAAQRREAALAEIEQELQALGMSESGIPSGGTGESEVLRERLLSVKAILQNGTDPARLLELSHREMGAQLQVAAGEGEGAGSGRASEASPFVVYGDGEDVPVTLLFDELPPPEDSAALAGGPRRLKALNLSLQEELFDAAEYGDARALLASLSRGATLAFGPDHPYKVSALHWAALGGHLSTIIPLLRLGLDPASALDHKNASALHYACDGNHTEVAELLLRAGASPNTPDANGRTPLHRGAVSGKVELVRTLLEHGADITAQDELKDTALHVAAYWGNEAVGRLLVKAGASIEQANRFGHCPLELALTTNRSSLVAFFQARLRAAGAPHSYVQSFRPLHRDPLVPFAPGVDPTKSSFNLTSLASHRPAPVPRVPNDPADGDDDSDQYSVMSSRFWNDRDQGGGVGDGTMDSPSDTV